MLLPHDDFAFAELDREGKEQTLRLVFAMHEVLVRGHSLQDGNVTWLKAETPGGFSRGEPPWQHGQGQDFFAFGIHSASLVKLMATAATWVLSPAV